MHPVTTFFRSGTNEEYHWLVMIKAYERIYSLNEASVVYGVTITLKLINEAITLHRLSHMPILKYKLIVVNINVKMNDVFEKIFIRASTCATNTIKVFG